jgi:hypothetical protein
VSNTAVRWQLRAAALKPRFFDSGPLLYLVDNLTCTGQRLDHLLALLSSADSVVALLEEFVQGVCPVHVLEELSLHLIFRESTKVSVERGGREECTYCTRLYMMALGTISISVFLTML